MTLTDVDKRTTTPNRITIDICHPCAPIEKTWPQWKLSVNEFLHFMAVTVTKLKIYGEELVALNV